MTDDAAASAANAEPAPRKKKPKKRRKSTSGDSAARPREGVPSFAQAFPSDPELDALVLAFERGNYARVRREAPRLADRTGSSEVRDSARELLRRLDPDPLAMYLLGTAVALLIVVSYWYLSHVHGA